jgi:hypothetical protein
MPSTRSTAHAKAPPHAARLAPVVYLQPVRVVLADRNARRRSDRIRRAFETEQRARLRNEGLVDLAGQLGGAILIDTVVAADGRMQVKLLTSVYQGKRVRTDSLRRSGRV